jgi:predicted GNAT family acetyltransferase
MEARRFEDPEAFAARAMDRLLLAPGRHSIFFSIVDTLRYRPEVYPSYVLLTAEDAGEVLGVAIRTAPYMILIAEPENEAALAALTASMQTLAPDAPGVVGARPEADEFAAAWIAARGGSVRVENRQGVFRLAEVRSHGNASGAMRVAHVEDLALIDAWQTAFLREAVPGHPADDDDRRRQLEGLVRGGSFRLWEDQGATVSMSGIHQAPPIGVRIGPVYTPPEFRGNGHATSLVAAASQEQLDAGRPACYLHTDLGNPTSNAIYQRIGYDWVCEAIDLRFVE